MKGYNKNKYQYNVQLSTNNKPISFEQMWAMNQAPNSPKIISNPLSKAYMNTGGDIGGAMQALAPIASLTPLGPLGGAIMGGAGSLISMFSKPSQANPTTGFANTNQYGHMATGGSMEQISPNAMEVTGGQGQVDGTDVNYKGQQMSLDHGEVVDTNQDIVFSNRLFDPRSGKSFADTVKPLEKLIGKLSKKPSVLNNNTIQALEKQKQVLFQTQEKVAQAMGKRNQDGSTVQPGQEQQMQQPGMAMGGRMKYGYGGQPDFTDLFNTPGYKMALQGAKEVSANNQTIPSLRNTGGLQETTRRKIPEQDIPNTAFDQRQGQFKYAKGFEEYAKQDLDPNLINKTAQAFLQSPEGQAHERIQKGLNPKYKGFKPDNVIGSNYNILFQNPAYKAMLQTPGQSIPNYATQALQTYQEGLIPKIPSGTTEDNRRSDDLDASPMGELFPQEKAKDRYNRLFGADTPYYTKPTTPKIKKSPYTTGDYMQLGAAGIQSIAALLDRPHTPPARIINSPITENRYNPARALQENQFTTNAAVNALGNNYSSAGVSSGLQNLYANKYKADSGIIQNYDQMNQQAKTQYEERLGQRDQFNSQIQTQNDVIKQQDRANYTNGLYNALESFSNVGKGLNQQETTNKYLDVLMKNDPDAYKSFVDNMKEETKKSTLIGPVSPTTTGHKYGGKIKFRKRR